jgi:hypothetical protein
MGASSRLSFRGAEGDEKSAVFLVSERDASLAQLSEAGALRRN